MKVDYSRSYLQCLLSAGVHSSRSQLGKISLMDCSSVDLRATISTLQIGNAQLYSSGTTITGWPTFSGCIWSLIHVRKYKPGSVAYGSMFRGSVREWIPDVLLNECVVKLSYKYCVDTHRCSQMIRKKMCFCFCFCFFPYQWWLIQRLKLVKVPKISDQWFLRSKINIVLPHPRIRKHFRREGKRCKNREIGMNVECCENQLLDID